MNRKLRKDFQNSNSERNSKVKNFISAFDSLNLNISEEDKKLYKYALKVLLQWLLNTITVLIIAIYFGMIKECLMLFGSFFVIRKFAGGFHFKKFSFCFLSSAFILFEGLMAIKFGDVISNVVWVITTGIFTLLLCICAPAKNSNKPLDESELHIFHYAVIVTSLIFFAAFLFLLRSANKHMAFSVAVGIIISSLTLLLTKIRPFKAANDETHNC